jgi:hypothetical protein
LIFLPWEGALITAGVLDPDGTPSTPAWITSSPTV